MKTLLTYGLIVVVGMALLSLLFGSGGGSIEQLTESQFLQYIEEGEIKEVTFTAQGDDLYRAEGPLVVGEERRFKTTTHRSEHLDTLLRSNEVDFEYKGKSGSLFGFLLNFLPLIIFGGILIFMMRRAGGANSEAMSFGKSRAKMNSGTPTVTFMDVAGQDEAKQELQEIVEFLVYPEKFAQVGARIPHGVLLMGSPGTGKTLLAKAVSGEASVPFFHISGSEFVEMFVGVGASRVRDLFNQAKSNAPAIIFVDEIDAVGRQRGAGLGGSHDEREQTLNQILVEMDGFDSSAKVIVIAATNRPDVLDPALLRPGRFDRQVTLDLPDVKGRHAVLDVHAKGKPLDEVDLEIVAKQTPGFSGADLANLINEAAILAARDNRHHIIMADFNESVDRVQMGPARTSRVITDEEKKILAYHEAGHVICYWAQPNADPPYKVTIVARGMAGGFTRSLPKEERRLQQRSYYEALMTAALGGHVAEEMVFGEMTTGAHDDIGKVTQIAREMVTRWGMSEKLGPRTFGQREQMVFLGRSISEQRDYSEETAREIDDEVKRFIKEAHERCREVLAEHRDKLDMIAKKLIEIETIEGDALYELLGPRPEHKPDTSENDE